MEKFVEFAQSIWLAKDGGRWRRNLVDGNKEVTHFIEEILHLWNAHNIVICNKLNRWKGSSEAICYTHNKNRMVDYLMVSESGMMDAIQTTLRKCKPIQVGRGRGEANNFPMTLWFNEE
jgi:hypothetical protein